MNQKSINKVWSVMEPMLQREFEVRETLRILTHNIPVWWSWGVNRGTISSLGGKCLLFKPKGRYFKGFVCITLGWDDVYQVHLVSNDYKLKKSIEGVYFDMLVDVIDGEVERR
jgi:hypothetical protein